MLQRNPAPVDRGAPATARRRHPGLRPGRGLAHPGVALSLLVAAVVASGSAIGALLAGGSLGRDIDTLAGHPRTAVAADWIVIVGFGLTLVLGTVLATQVVFDPHCRAIAGFARLAAVLAVVGECAGILASGLDQPVAAAVASVLTVGAALPASLVAITGLGLTAVRLGAHVRTDGPGLAAEPGPTVPTGPAEAGPRTRWRRGYDTGRGPDLPALDAAVGDRIGVGLSGGGIRAASVMLGAFQDPDMREKVLNRARYLVAVSGGGFVAGAFQQALTAAGPAPTGDETALRDPRLAFVEGSPEEEHIRRHASYLAANPVEVLVALGLLMRHLLLNLVLLFGPAIALGVLAGCFLNRVPLTSLRVAADGTTTRLEFAAVARTTWIAIAAVALLVVLSWLGAQWAAAHCDPSGRPGLAHRLRHALNWATPAIGLVFWSVVALTLGLPAVIWAAAWILSLGDRTAALGGSVGAVLITYGASLAALLWRHRKYLTDDSPQIPQAVPRGVGQILLVILALGALAACWLLLFGGAATTVLGADHTGDWVGAVLVLLVVVFLGGFVDETTLSLHPFYRRRLARTFAVRSVRRPGEPALAVPLAPAERTTLSRYGVVAPAVARQFPEVIFAASATVGDGRTPAGANRVSYTFSSEFVGGPEVGYVPTSKLERQLSPRLQRDLTVQGAVALSGAALAASVGTQNAKWYEALFAVSGLRLGAWMPNPGFLTGQTGRGGRAWYEPGLPRVRRMSYLLRELFGAHPAGAPLVQVSDGGFYDNLGLIELFRRRCTTICCIDASADSPPVAATVAQVVGLAYQELGVRVHLDDAPFATTPGSGKPPTDRPNLPGLDQRMSETGVMRVRFTYPPESGLPADRRTGTLVVAKALLWPSLPYQLQAYAVDNPVFPHDSTADQWFDDGQYGAYTALGRALGAAAAAALTARVDDPAVTPPAGAEKIRLSCARPAPAASTP